MAVRLNKKVALLGSVIFVILAIGAVAVILHLSRDPEKFIADGDAAWLEKDYEAAEKNYLRAHARAKDDSLKVEVLYKLIDVFMETQQWPKVRGSWQGIVEIEPENFKIRYARLKYYYIIADGGARQIWKEIESQASDFLELVEEKDLLMEQTSQWESPSFEKAGFTHPSLGVDKVQRIGPYLYLLRGRAALEIARAGAVTNPDELLSQAFKDFEKVLELEPANVNAALYLGHAYIAKGEIATSRGGLGEREKAQEKALEILERVSALADTNPQGHLNLLSMKTSTMITKISDRQDLLSLEPQYLALVEKFPEEPDVYFSLSMFYRIQGHKYLDKSIKAIEKAMELAPQKVKYAISAAELYYSDFSINGHNSELYKAIETAKKALALPGAQDTLGPRQFIYINNKAILHSLLAGYYIEQLLEPSVIQTDSEKQKWLADAEQAVHEIEQLLGSGDDPRVMKWQGLLELARGDRGPAVRKLYAAYEQLKASRLRDAQLSYALAKYYENTTELGAANEFYSNALSLTDRTQRNKIDERKPGAILDYAELLLKLRAHRGTLNMVSFFENSYGTNDKSKELRIKALIQAREFDDAEKELADALLDDPNTMKLKMNLLLSRTNRLQINIRQKQISEDEDIALQLQTAQQEPTDSQATVETMNAELKQHKKSLAELVENLLTIEPNSVPELIVAGICGYYREQGKKSEAESLVNRFLQHFPENVTVRYQQEMLTLPEEISPEKMNEIEQKVRADITDPAQRAVALGVFYLKNNESDRAFEVLKNIMEPYLTETQTEESEFTDMHRIAVSYLFDLTFQKQDWPLAQKIISLARRENIDQCEGDFFRARLDFARSQYQSAMEKVNACLKQRPVFSQAFILRSRLNTTLGNQTEAIEDATKAVSLNPLDGSMRKILVFTLYERNRKLGANVSSDQLIELTEAFQRALALNPGDLGLLGTYAEYISPTEPRRALSIRQSLQKTAPSLNNAMLLGSLATRLATDETDQQQKDALFDIAEHAFEQAREIDPANKMALYSYTKYLRIRGQNEKAEELLLNTEDRNLLWAYYFDNGQFEKAHQILLQLYESEPNNPQVMKGIMLIAERTGNQDEMKKFSDELLAIDDSVENNLFQIQSLLKTGLVKEAELKLQSFREKYPDEPRALMFEAWVTLRKGQLQKALELTNRILETEEANARAWYLRGQINRLMANYNQAITDLNKAKSFLDEPATRIELARAYVNTNRLQDALTELAVLVDNPQAPMEARLLTERIYLQLGRKDSIVRFYNDMLEKFPEAVLWYNRSARFALSEEDTTTAEKLYQLAWTKSVEQDQPDASSLEGYLRSLLASEKYDKVLEEGRKYIDSDSAPIAFLAMANAKMQVDDRDAATQYCRKAVENAQDDEELAANILRAMFTLLGAQEVEDYCNEKLDEEPDSLSANYAMFNLAAIAGQHNKAVEYIDKCIRIAGPDTTKGLNYTLRKATTLQIAFQEYSDNIYLKKALNTWESLLEKLPNNTNILNNFAYILAKNDKRLDEALEYAERALEANPNNPVYLDTYAYVLYKNGRFDEAAERIQAALQQYERQRTSVPAEVYENLGSIKEKLNANDEAAAAYKRALELGENQFNQAKKEQIKAAIERLSN